MFDWIREFIRTARLCEMSDKELDEYQREIDEANTTVVPGPSKTKLTTIYSTFGTKDSDFDYYDEEDGDDEEEEEKDGVEGDSGAEEEKDGNGK